MADLLGAESCTHLCEEPQKERKRRLRDVGDALTELDEALTAPPTFETTHAAIAQPASWRQALPLALGALIMGSLITGLAVWTMMRPAPPAPQLTARSTLTLPATDQLAQIPQLRLALSPDGSTLVYTAVRDGVTQLYRRELDQLEAVAIPGTENAIGPFFKPDGEWLAFASDGVLKKVALRGGPATTICDLPNAFRHATWTADDTIIFGVATSGLLRVPGAGGEPRSFLDLEEGEDVHQTPEVLPGDRAVLFRSTSGDRRVVMVHSLDTGERRELVEGSSPHYVPTGHLVFGRAGSLWAVPFDLDELDVSGEPVPILEGVVMGIAAGGPGPPAQAVFASTDDFNSVDDRGQCALDPSRKCARATRRRCGRASDALGGSRSTGNVAERQSGHGAVRASRGFGYPRCVYRRGAGGASAEV